MFIFEQPQTDFSGSFAGGQASGGQIIDATIRSMWQVENTNAASVAIQDAMSQRIDAIKEATGVQLQHPLDRLHTALGNGDIPEGSGERDSLGAVPDVDKIAQFFFDDFTKQLADLAKNHPDKAEIIGADRSLVSDARKLSIEADEQFGKMFGSRDDIIVPYGALLFGGAVGAMRAPIEAFTLLLGAGPGAGRLVAQRVLHTAAREFAINAGAEAALQPAVQSYRKSLGLEAGFDLAVRNVAFAGILGAAFGGTVQGGAEIVSAAARRKVADRQFAAAAEALASDSPLRDLETMSGEATAKLLEPIRYDLSPEARGAIDMTEVLVALDEYRVPGVPDEQFDVSAAQGIRFAEDPEVHSLPASLVDDIRDDFDVPRPKKPAGRRPDNLTRFIARQGGLRRDLITDDAGDLLGGGVKGSRGAIKAGDLDKVFVPGVGALVRKEGGLTINQARELAAEAGFLRGFGTAEEAIENSSDADFLADLLQDVEGKENRVFAEADHATAEEFRQFDEQISGNQRDLDDALNNLDDALSDDVSLDLKRRAVELQLEERIDAGDALERAILEEQVPPQGVTPARITDLDGNDMEVPFFDDEIDTGSAGAQRSEVAQGSRGGERGTSDIPEPFSEEFRDTGPREARPGAPEGGIDQPGGKELTDQIDQDLAPLADEAAEDIPLVFDDGHGGEIIKFVPAAEALADADRPGDLADIIRSCKV